MTPRDLYDAIRQDAGRYRYAAEVLDSDEAAANALSGAFSDEELLPLVWSASDAVAAVVDPRHVPGCVEVFTGDFTSGAPVNPRVLRFLPSRVYARSGYAGLEVLGESDFTGGGPPVSGALLPDLDDGTEYRPLLRVTPEWLSRRRGGYATASGVYTFRDGVLTVPNDAEVVYEAVAAAPHLGDTDALRLPRCLQRAVVAHAIATVLASRGSGVSVVARNAFLRAVMPYRPGGEMLQDSE